MVAGCTLVRRRSSSDSSTQTTQQTMIQPKVKVKASSDA